MHPTANSVALIVNLRGFDAVCAAGDAGRYVSASRGSQMLPAAPQLKAVHLM
jgi:hypothetical protein